MIESIPRDPAVAHIAAETLARETAEPLAETIDCSRNEFLHPHPIPVASWPRIDAGSICRYQPNPRSLTALSERFDCDTEVLRVHNGAEAALKTIFASVAQFDDATVLIPRPGWEYHDTLAARYGLRTETYRHLEIGDGEERRYALDIADLTERIDRTVRPIVLIVSPSNPLGNRVPDSMLRTLAQQVSEKGGYCIVDQAYFGFAESPNNDWSVGESLEDLPGTILVRTLSKFYGIPGVRVGFTAAHRSVHERLGIEPDYLGFSVFADEFAVACLGAHEEFRRIAAAVVRQRDELTSGFSRIPGFQPFCSDANFLLVRTPSPDYALWLADHGIRVRTFTGELADCVRITVPPEEQVRRLLTVTELFGAHRLSGHPTPTAVK